MLEIHPIAMDSWDMDAETFTAFKEDIRQHGLRNRIVLYEGKVLDGRHRYRALCELESEGHLMPSKYWREFTGTLSDAVACAESLNKHRRHLTPEQKRSKIKAQLLKTPEKSDRAIAEEVGKDPGLNKPPDHKTVAVIRDTLNRSGEIPQYPIREGTDGFKRNATQPPKTATSDGPQPIPKKVPDRGKISGVSKAEQLNAMRSQSSASLSPFVPDVDAFMDDGPSRSSIDFDDALQAIETVREWFQAQKVLSDRVAKRWAIQTARAALDWAEAQTS